MSIKISEIEFKIQNYLNTYNYLNSLDLSKASEKEAQKIEKVKADIQLAIAEFKKQIVQLKEQELIYNLQ